MAYFAGFGVDDYIVFEVLGLELGDGFFVVVYV